ncbi:MULTISPECIES: adenylate/guanylate cyclase domain-containing protein [unclassified Leptolyngbya]|uniref:adenylate/guanylate cyclase domain-containing protein n=1 Tax=unclassified Leptolyngbya TaxID=2650499 RepID=UPI0016869A34|nr:MULTISPECIES: adenylate/guanylate cyclase domain-containing protein [unclassified Leptolyngbya]MBD1911979.1 adenylate/guanylate cyclase domain-containing protein [Leptolyngbya sp. FACHB-8]MBD2156048.1 adenylate/guanylate cyclase domain-containing protein [Leptolyngbya sp. FACHB-16]
MLERLPGLWNTLLRWLLKRIVLVLMLLFCIGAGIALSNMSRLSSNLIESQAVINAKLYIQTFNQAIDLYSESAADRAKVVNGISVTHAYLNKKGGIPLPSTFAIELGQQVSDENHDLSVRFFSDYPFPWRKKTGGAKDAFEHEALAYLRQHSKETYVRFEQHNGGTFLRYAEPSIMKPSCVTCHNTHLDSPKTDWQVGDVAGVWEISQPLNSLVTKVKHDLRETSLMLGGISVLGLSGLTLVIGKLRETARELEGRVRERTADLAQANTDLAKRNQLIRQVFGRYLSDEVVVKLLESPEALKLGGDRRNITILTSDLRGFTALSERLPPEEVINVLNLYLEYMADVINKYQGTIDEFMGDGILVLFGAPTPRQDDALRAVVCAVSMQLAMGAVNEHMRILGMPPLEMGIGINTGDVVVGNIGSEKRTKYGIVGNQVNLTYRIESFTCGGQILISEQTLRAAGSSVRIGNQRQVQMKGVKGSVTLYEVYGVAGFHNLYLPRMEEVFVALTEALPLHFIVLDGKAMGGEVFQGKLMRLSPKGAEVAIAPTALQHLSEFANLKLNLFMGSESVAQDDIYAKVAGVNPDQSTITLQFTAVPPRVQEALATLYQSCSV